VGLEHVVLERGEVGETWRTQRWDSFTLNTPNWATVLPGTLHDGDAPDAFATTAEWIEDLGRYAREQTLPVRTRTPVTAVDADGSGGFSVTTAEGETLRTRNVVVASGVQNAPKVPRSAADLEPMIERLTTATYRRPSQLAPGAILVVGGAQSGCQIAEDLVDAGREVYLAAGKVGRLPRRLRGRDVVAWLTEAGWFQQRPQDLPDPAMVRWAQPQVSGTGPVGHTVSYQSLAERGVNLLGHFEGASGTRVRFADDLAAHIAFADEISARIHRMVDEHIARTGVSAAPNEPDPADAPVADPSRYVGPAELDLAERGIRSVIFSTGFGGDLSWLRVPVLDERGAPVHVEGRAPVDGVWFVGLPWQRVRRSGIISGAGDDSAFVVDQIVGRTSRATGS